MCRVIASVSLCLCVRALKRKRLELSTPDLVHIIYSMAGHRHTGSVKNIGCCHGPWNDFVLGARANNTKYISRLYDIYTCLLYTSDAADE